MLLTYDSPFYYYCFFLGREVLEAGLEKLLQDPLMPPSQTNIYLPPARMCWGEKTPEEAAFEERARGSPDEETP